MKIILNGDAREVRAMSLAAALEELGFGGAVVATAVNGELVSAGARAARSLSEGDALEVLAPMQGG
jgi:sulfur carrier protein